MYIEGKNPVYEALRSNATINKIFVDKNYKNQLSQIVAMAKQNKIRIDFVDKKILDNKSVTKKHQGVICETTEFDYSTVEDILNLAKEKDEAPFIVILDGIEDPHNLGAIIRTCECVGVHGIVIQKYRACPVNETVIRTSAGATSNMLVARVTNINNTIDELKKEGVWVYGLDMDGKDIYSCNLQGPIALVVGSEGSGISQLTLKKCDDVVALPMYGKINSLNASVACAVAVYQIKNKR